MSGPKTTRLPGSLTAPSPSLTNPTLQLLQGFLQNPQQALQSLVPQQASPLQQTVGNTFQQLLSTQPGGDVIAAAQPVFQRNLTEGLARQRNVGPRFARSAGEQSRLLETNALQDFNLFMQNVLESGLQRQLSATQAAGNFALGQQQTNQNAFLPILQQLLSTVIKGSGVEQPPTLEQKPGTLQNILGIVGSVAPFVAGGFNPLAFLGGGARSLPQGQLPQTPQVGPLAMPWNIGNGLRPQI